VRARTNRNLNKALRVKTSATITFNAFRRPDQLTVTDQSGTIVINTPANFNGQQVWVINNATTQKADRHRIRVNSNSMNQNGPTVWNLTIQKNEQVVKRRTTYKFLGILRYKTEVKKQIIDPVNPINNGSVITRMFGIRTKKTTSTRNINTNGNLATRRVRGRKRKKRI
jgi:hypothetical protein